MTLNTYSPQELDQFALRLLDLAANLREMARKSRESQIVRLPLNDKKAQEWCGRLEQWILRAQAELETRVRMAKATRRARRPGS